MTWESERKNYEVWLDIKIKEEKKQEENEIFQYEKLQYE